MNFVLHGVAVSAGITIGHAHLVSSARLEAAHYEIPEAAVQGEIFRFDAAIARAKQELAALVEKALSGGTEGVLHMTTDSCGKDHGCRDGKR